MLQSHFLHSPAMRSHLVYGGIKEFFFLAPVLLQKQLLSSRSR
jgi:hypothetical protein